MSAWPRVSVVVPAYNSERTIEATLQALERQSFDDFETIVVDSSPGDGTARLLAERFPEVIFDRSPTRLRPHAARNRGMELARGELLVFSDPDCVAARDWLERLIASHDRGHPVVGGAIGLEGGGWLERGIHVSKFSAWDTGAAAGPRPDLATANALWPRELIERLGPFPDERWSGDTELSWRAASAGIKPYFEPRAIVRHTHTTTMREFWRERRARGEDFAAMRAEVGEWRRGRGLVHLLAVPLVPPLLFSRALRRAGLRGLGRVMATAPVQLVGYAAWSMGEARAYARTALGRGRA